MQQTRGEGCGLPSRAQKPQCDSANAQQQSQLPPNSVLVDPATESLEEHYISGLQPEGEYHEFNRMVTTVLVRAWRPGVKALAEILLGKEQLVYIRHLCPASAFEPGNYGVLFAGRWGKGKAVQGAADTIFLLSDGAPTGADGQPLPRDALEKAYEAFLDANRVARCVVHTIGIGPGHNAWFMRQLAEDTGGQYLAVGTR